MKPDDSSLSEWWGDITIGEVQFKSGLFMILKVLDLFISSDSSQSGLMRKQRPNLRFCVWTLDNMMFAFLG
jgi:hypothetical protein